MLVSDGYCGLLGCTREQMMEEQERSKMDRVHPKDAGPMAQALSRFWKKEAGYDVLYRVKCADNRYHRIHSVACWWYAEDGTELILAVYLDLRKWAKEMKKLRDDYHLSQQDIFYLDPLTSLPNINYLNRFADERVSRIRTHGGTPVLIYSDTHSMQFYNNQYGFSRGNELLKTIAEELQAAFPDGLVMRGADDHFVVIDTFPGRAELEERILAANRKIRGRAYGNTSGIQAGIALFEEESAIGEVMDHARQTVKLIRDDLNKVVSWYSEGVDEEYWNQRYIVENFERAMEEGWIKIYYQCIARAETGKAAALEALARWVDPVRGMIPPGEFIPVLRRYHLLYKLDLYMTEQVCREIPIRAENGLQLLPVSINFAAQDFDNVDVPNRINELYEQYEISRYCGREYFVIEITEQDIASTTDRFRAQL